MKKTGFIILALAIGFSIWGCGKKEPVDEFGQEAMSMESLSTMSTVDTKAMPEMKPEVKVAESKPAVVATAVSQPQATLEPLPPGGPYKPTATEIQTALKNAGLYAGNIDGKIGPKTKAAIEEFQKANNLTADGKVGPKTWAALSQHLNAPQASEGKKAKR